MNIQPHLVKKKKIVLTKGQLINGQFSFQLWKNDSPLKAIAFSSFGSLGLRCSLRLDVAEDLPKLKKERQLPTGDFLDLM